MLGEMMIMLQQLENTQSERHTRQGLPKTQTNENGHAYPRFWRYEFKRNNFIILKSYKAKKNQTMFVLKKKIKNY